MRSTAIRLHQGIGTMIRLGIGTRAPLGLLAILVVTCEVRQGRAEEPIAWRSDYNAARKEAEEKGLPLFIEIGTEACFYCRKLEVGPFRDPAIAKMIEKSFVPLKIDANREPNLTRALKVNLYPTMVLAGSDGKIHAFLEGYMDTQRLHGQMERVLSTTFEAYAKELQEGVQAIAVADYPRAVEILKTTIANASEKPLAGRARGVLEPIERKAASKLALARELEDAGRFEELTDALAEVVTTYRGTRAADDAVEILVNLGDQPERRLRAQAAARKLRAQELLDLAKGEFRTMKYHQCLEHCDQLATQFTELPESKEASALALDIQTDPERLAIAGEQLKERTAAMHLSLAEAWVRKGQVKEAAACLESVVQMCPNTRLSEEAKARLTSLGSTKEAYPTGFRKN